MRVGSLKRSRTELVAALEAGVSMADRHGPKRILQVAAIAMLSVCYPLMLWLTISPTIVTLVTVQCLLAVILAAFTGPAGGALASLFPAEIRSTGVSIAYNLAVTLFGGFASFIATWLIGATGNPLAPVWYVAFAAATAVVGSFLLPSRRPS